jgi:hypothetical protein
MKLSRQDPMYIWEVFFETHQENENSGFNLVKDIQNEIAKKISGLPVELTFSELEKELEDALIKYIKNEKEEPMINYAKNLLDDLKINSNAKFDLLELDPKHLKDKYQLAFRSQLSLLDIENKDPMEVIMLIINLYKKFNPNFDLNNYYSNSLPHQITKCFSLMNWAKYFPDDYQKIKGNRFRASSNDRMHVRNAVECALLVSKDKKFLMKADACYKHLNIPTIVCDPQQALKKIKNE